MDTWEALFKAENDYLDAANSYGLAVSKLEKISRGADLLGSGVAQRAIDSLRERLPGLAAAIVSAHAARNGARADVLAMGKRA